MGFYEKYIKRVLDIICSLLIIVVFWWLFLIIAIIVKVNLGSPVLFKQPRPGLVGDNGQEKIFFLYKFRTMTDVRGEGGELLPDEVRLTKFGKWLRSTSLDELPEMVNILWGDMSLIGPRPQLVRDMVFMSTEQRIRHTAKPGLSGLAQINGRNAISWDDKIEWDLIYTKHVNFIFDIKILVRTIKQVFGKNESKEEINVTFDYGDALLESGDITLNEYKAKQEQIKEILSYLQNNK